MPLHSGYTPELGDAICARLVTGDVSLRQVAREIGVSHSTILLWALREPTFADQYARACEIRDEASMELIDDLRTEEPERVTIEGPKGAKQTSVDNSWVQWKRVQMDAIKWQLAKRRPKKYGDKLDLNHSGGVNVTLSERLAKAREASPIKE